MRLLCWFAICFMGMALLMSCCNLQVAKGDIDDKYGGVIVDDNTIKGDKPEVIK